MTCEQDESEQTEELSGRAFMLDLARRIGEMPPEELAYRVIRSYFSTEQPKEKATERFLLWLCSDRNAAAKERAMERFFDEQDKEQ